LYFGARVKVAGGIQKVEVDKDALFVYGSLGPTTKRSQPFCVHICPRGCGLQGYYLHAVRGRKGKEKEEEGWIRSLEPPRDEGRDELEELRRRERELLTERDARNAKEARKEQKKKKESEESKETTEEEKKKKKKKKSKDKNEELLSERHAGRAVQKELSQLYAGTALDPVYAKRRRQKLWRRNTPAP